MRHATTTAPSGERPTSQRTRFARIDLIERRDAVADAAHVADELGRRACAAGGGGGPRRCCCRPPRPSRRRAPRASRATPPRPARSISASSTANSRAESSTARAPEAHAPRRRVELSAPHAISGAAGRPGAASRAHAREQLVEVERLHQIVVGAAVEAGDAVGHRVARGDDEHRQRLLPARRTAFSTRGRRGAAGRGRAARGRRRRGRARVGLGAVAHPVDRVAAVAQARRTARPIIGSSSTTSTPMPSPPADASLCGDAH